MKKIIILFLLFTFHFILFNNLSADFIIPQNDAVYPFLESMQTLGYMEDTYFIYPQYHDEIIKILDGFSSKDLSNQYKKLVEYHKERLSCNFSDGFKSAIYPPKKIQSSILNLFKPHSDKKHIFTYAKDETKLFFSARIGFHKDFKNEDITHLDSIQTRTYEYNGLEFGGNISDNFGFLTQYRKGHYSGDTTFIDENLFVHQSGGETRLLSTCSELDYKNNILNLSIGYGTFQVGKTITSSIILNPEVTPYGYLKYYKKFGKFHYLGFVAQLLPDSLTDQSVDYQTKSYALQMLYYDSKVFSFGLGQCAIYGDETLDLAYATPMMIF
ncbi:MAG: hypothetical protein ISS38_04710, partial [Candidatus Cloacimonetes bacterium]|nr:hypothetical protein [Candidatus Cloacimonadota bacterium]